MKFYNVTRGQLVTLWAFWFLGLLFGLPATESDFMLWLVYISLGFLIFYTIGWRNFHRR